MEGDDTVRSCGKQEAAIHITGMDKATKHESLLCRITCES